MPATQLTKEFKKLALKKVPERNTEALLLHRLGKKTRLQESIIIKQREVQLEPSTVGPKPVSIEKFKVKKNKAKAGRRQQIKRNIEQLKSLITNAKTEENKIWFSTLLSKAKNDLNRLRKGKKIK